MKKFRILPLILILLLVLSVLPGAALAVSDPQVSARAAILVNADTGEVYYEKNADQTVEPASCTKLMTALLVAEAVERGDITLGDEVTATGSSRYNLEDDSSTANPIIEPGETMTVEELLYCAMLVSANEACNILAEYVSGSVSDFVDVMNARAQELGCMNTHFVNPNGLQAADHYTTAADFAAIAREAVTHPTVVRICGTVSHTVPATNVTEERSLTNTNGLINPDSSYYYEYATGLKTGYFEDAGYCLVSSASNDDISLVCVVFGSTSAGGQFDDSLTLYHWLFDNFEFRQILSTTETVVTVPVELGTSDTVGVRAEDIISVILPKDYDLGRIGYNYVLYHEAEGRTLEAPLSAGEVLGEITVVELDEAGGTIRTFGTSRLVAASNVEISRKDYLRTQADSILDEEPVRKIITLLVIILAVYLLLVLFYLIQRIRHMHSLRQAKRDRAFRQAQADAQWLELPRSERDEEPKVSALPRSQIRQTDEQAEHPSLRGRRADDAFFDSFFDDDE